MTFWRWTAVALIACLLLLRIQGFINTTPFHPCACVRQMKLVGKPLRQKMGFFPPLSVSSKSEDMLVDPVRIEVPLTRAKEIASVFSSQILNPVVRSLLAEGFPSSWNDFWAFTYGGITNGQRVAVAMEKLGPTYVKFGQALGSRPDIVPRSLAEALTVLQDRMEPFDSRTAKDIIEQELRDAINGDDLNLLLQSLSDEPVAAASVGQVYSGVLPNYGRVAVKVQRPGIRQLAQQDAELLRIVAKLLESIPALPNKKAKGKAPNRLIATELLAAVEEFMSRIFEELDYRNEAANAAKFAGLYSDSNSDEETCVIVPEIRQDLCTDNVLVMEWVEGTKLTAVDKDDNEGIQENLRIIEKGIACTLDQLLVTGVLHADPHGANLLKVSTDEGQKLCYLDFGILATIPQQVRDGLVCSVSHLVFAQDCEAVASLFAELQLLPEEIINDPIERAALTESLGVTFDECLVYSEQTDDKGTTTSIPVLKFDKLLDALVRFVPRFQFKLPPYFINNARAMSTLEGIARTLDPSFNVFEVMYPYALNRLLTNPEESPIIDRTLQQLIRDPANGRFQPSKFGRLLADSALATGFSRRKVLWDILKTNGGRKLAWMVAKEELWYAVSSQESRTEFLRL